MNGCLLLNEVVAVKRTNRLVDEVDCLLIGEEYKTPAVRRNS